MTLHKCNRESCPPANVNGPKINCAKCGIVVFALCFGWKPHGSRNDLLRMVMSNGTKFIVPISSLNFFCPVCDTKNFRLPPSTDEIENEDTVQQQMSTNEPSNDVITAINELKETMIKKNDEIATRLDQIGPMVVDTLDHAKTIWQRLISCSGVPNRMAYERFKPPSGKGNGTPVMQTANEANETPKQRPLFSTVLQRSLPVTSQPNSASKRKRDTELVLIDNTSLKTVQKKKLPTPKQGTKNVQIGKPLETRKTEPKLSNPLSKSVWVSGFHPETSNEEVEEFIVNNTSVNDKSKFKCTKLVKKEHDITKMSFVSFKIDVMPDDFSTIVNPDIWPQQINVREFVTMTPPKQTLGSFMPTVKSTQSSPQRESKITRTGDLNESAPIDRTNIEKQNQEMMAYANELGIDPGTSAGNSSSKNVME